MNRERRQNSGSTLLEVILALAVFSFTTILISQTISIGIKSYQNVVKKSERRTAAADRLLLRKLLLTAFERKHENGPDAYFFADSERLTFFSYENPYQTPWRPITLRRTDTHLVLEFQTESGVEHRNLVANAGNFEVLLLKKGTSGLSWTRIWEKEFGLPALITIVDPTASRPEWPEFTVAPRLSK